jgi:hypothetical protein
MGKKKKRSRRGGYDAFVPATERMVTVLETLAAVLVEEQRGRLDRRRARELREVQEELQEEREAEKKRTRMRDVPLSSLIKDAMAGEDRVAVGNALRELRDCIRPELLERKLGDVIESGISYCEWVPAYTDLHGADEPPADTGWRHEPDED